MIRLVFYLSLLVIFIFVIMSCIMTWAIVGSISGAIEGIITISDSTLHKIDIMIEFIEFCCTFVGLGLIYFVIKGMIKKANKKKKK